MNVTHPGSNSRRRLSIPLRSGTAACVVAAILLADALTLPIGSSAGELARGVLGAGGTHCWFGLNPSLIRDANGLRVTDEPEPAGTVVTYLMYSPRSSDRGCWAVTQRVDEHVLHMDRSKLAPGEEAVARRLFADFLITHSSPGLNLQEEASLIRNSDTITRTVIPVGYIHNALSGAMFGLLVYSLASMRRWPATQAAAIRRRARLLGYGVCPSCRYDLTDNTTGICPECGSKTLHP
jgi:hypothetical protein